jgi:hypothetical protein
VEGEEETDDDPEQPEYRRGEPVKLRIQVANHISG